MDAKGKNRTFYFSCWRIAFHRQTGNVNFRDKIVDWDELPAWRAAVRADGRKLVVTNGCFDILHLGHVTYLESARNLATRCSWASTAMLRRGS